MKYLKAKRDVYVSEKDVTVVQNELLTESEVRKLFETNGIWKRYRDCFKEYEVNSNNTYKSFSVRLERQEVR